jgi:hypothetical protein
MEERPPPSVPEATPLRTLLVAAAVLVAVAAAAVLLPASLSVAALAIAFVAGIVLERYRQSHSPLPPALSDTPATWWETFRDGVGLPYALAALLLIGAASAVLLLSFRGSQEQPAPAPPTPTTAGPRPSIDARSEPASKPFDLGGAQFVVDPSPGAEWASAFRARGAGHGQRWLVVAVEVTNLHRHRFNPALIPYRVRAADGTLYGAERAGAVGPNSISTASGLPPHATAEERLAFRIPTDQRNLTLLFEPVANGRVQARVPLPAT